MKDSESSDNKGFKLPIKTIAIALVSIAVLAFLIVGLFDPFGKSKSANTDPSFSHQQIVDSPETQKLMTEFGEIIKKFDALLANSPGPAQLIDIQGGIDEERPYEFSITVLLKGNPNHTLELILTSDQDMQDYAAANLSAMSSLDVRLEEIENDIRASKNKLSTVLSKKDSKYRLQIGAVTKNQFIQGSSLYIDFIPIKDQKFILQIADEHLGKYISNLKVSLKFRID
jgi:hypothetical protein